MFHNRFSLPSPFYNLEVFDLVEVVSETDTDITFEHRLYMPNRFAPGGKVLLKTGNRETVAKAAICQPLEDGT